MWPFRTVELERQLHRALTELAEYKSRKQADTRSIEQIVVEQNAKFAAMNKARAMETSSLLGGSFGLVGTAPAKPKLATDLPMTRVADLAGYLGRVHEQLSFAALTIAAPIKPGAAVDAIALRLRDAADKAASVQMDLLTIIHEEREREAAAAVRQQTEAMVAAMNDRDPSPQWTTEEMEVYRRGMTNTEPLEPNRIKPVPTPLCPMCDGDGVVYAHACLTCGGTGLAPLNDPFEGQKS
jgi:hypothetical protein